ncbi:thiamine pyrophosphate-dependent enzyme [Rhizobium sullae]|uniref:Thiamine pyrophosphate-dependent enzyme n=1 Tax=Rhizobium sullae TaxID=50338 RepID=A0A4R3PR19_RHISU|nr:thiamine pyrophosphate-dependent enzyme [Rhizobium sullae]
MAQRRKRKVKGSDLFVRGLEEQGVRCIFGIPGEENLHLMESIRKSKIKFVTTRSEWGAALMAATYGRLTGKTGVCLATCGPGVLNFPNGAGYAFLGGMPLLMIGGQKAIKSRPQAGFQRVDAVAVMKPVTKLAIQIASAQLIPSMVRESFRVTQEGKQGPVYLELPEDIAAEKCEEEEV